MFKHNICGGQPEVLDGMLDFANPLPPKFFASPRCPLVRVSSGVAIAEVRRGKAVDRGVPILGIQMEHLLLFLPRSPFFFFCNGSSMVAWMYAFLCNHLSLLAYFNEI